MAYNDVTRVAVLAAVAEFDRVGRGEFLRAAGFGRAKHYFLDIEGRLYDSKAIVGHAHGVSGDGPWRSKDLLGAERTVAALLRALGFTVRFLDADWTWDEIVLACALVEANRWRTVAQEDSRAIELSRLLQSTAIHPLEMRPPGFRNPAGVERKTGDLVSRLPRTGRKHTNGNHLDKKVVQAFLDQPDEMRAKAEVIATVLREWPGEPEVIPDVDLEGYAGKEGGVFLRAHLRRERDPSLKPRKIAQAKKDGAAIACEVCGFDFSRTYGERGHDYIECHHRVPLHVTGPVDTALPDLALLCSNCHRMIHRSAPWLTVEDLRELVMGNRTGPRGSPATVDQGSCSPPASAPCEEVG
ncbi:HNH endonuclease [Micromonospora maritima]|uniref:HNH endonuclease n=1 Tax=Micromonospora maritima TaxID=986711 RepID=UPI001FEAE210|nr:HNH endonuclease [Micromonospora maritima]